jgi:(p)ppGpp synthase/HD superfamily hydrolase
MRDAFAPKPLPKGASLVVKAASFAAWKHSDQRRKDVKKTPYINHPLEVANILQGCGVDDDEILAAAILHDTVEDTDTTFGEIELLFGSNVMRYVRQVTDDRTLSKVERKKHQVEVAKVH